MSQKILIVILLFLSVFTLRAEDEVKLTASAPSTVIMGRPFQVKYTANAKVTDFKAPAITNFDILAGPFKSESYSSQIINGNMTSSFSIAYTFTLQAQKTGTFSIPSATIFVGDDKYTSNGLSIKVLPADEEEAPSGRSATQPADVKISSENIFIRPVLSRTNVFEQEAFRLSYKLYTTYDIVQYNVKEMPDFQGFLKQEVEKTSNTQLQYENYNGKNYLTAVLYEIILFPQSSGTLTIDKAVFEAIIRVQSRQPVRSIFDEFFESYSNVARRIEVPATRINVKSVPDGRPISYNGVVGNFSLSSSLSTEQVKVNEAVTLKVSISGSGNMKLLPTPEIVFPESFEVYDPKVINNFKPSSTGLTGTKVIEYTFIPRHAGTFEIPSFEMSYFNPSEAGFKLMRTPDYNIQVLKSDGTVDDSPVISNYSNKEDVKQLGTDIRHIYTGAIHPTNKEIFLIESFRNWLFLILPFILFVFLYLIFRKHIKDNADLEMVKNRKANKLARKRLRVAQKFLQSGNKEKFYEEVMKALWTYLSDKLSIPVSSLNLENVTVVLEGKELPAEIISQLKEIIHTCEFARFAPGTGQLQMGNLYEESVDIIMSLERSIKK